jgi:hypothetical protein
MSFDSITNRGEFFSNHYLDAIIGGDLGDLRRTWDEHEKAHQDTARSRLKALSKPFFAARADVTEANNDANARRAIELLNGHVLLALGLKVDRQRLTLTHTTTDELQVPVAATVETGSGLHLLALEAGLPDDVDDLFATGAGEQGRLLDPVHKVREKLDIVDPAEAVSALFAVDDPPRWVLVVAGRTVLLAERARWAEGRFLAVDLDTALERNDTSPKGEIETIAALFSTDALVPHDGQAFIDELADKSTKHAVGVSKELREGIRHSIEILANEVIQRRLDKNLGVYSGDNRIDPRDLTTQCLRYLYRLLVLLYAESRPELGIVPVDDEVYMAGYRLDRLRELTLTELDTDKARHGTHLNQSLRSLFELVNEGYHAANVAVAIVFDVDHDDADASYEDYLQFPGLDAQLFDPSAVPLIDSVTLRNEPLQKVLQLLMLSPKTKGKRADRGFISYAQLGINQLGAVYEGLMAYTGFFADSDLYEVAKNGDPSDGTWVLPIEKADEYPEDVFVTREDPLTGAEARVLHPKGSFVFRLSGRERQRSASYYTPEVLTRCVVKHALAELLGTDDYAPENGSSGITDARQILDLTICEPALGSGAFLNEAINQLSAEYLKRRQAELGETLDPEQYNRELQKVKAHFALHQSYGVDLNATAVELAEVSLWLNCMHPGLKAPWFGMQLRRGNSLVGCRRATWKASRLKDKPWAKTNKDDLQPPADRPLNEALADDEIHHFLLPGHGWAAVADRKEAKELRADEVKALKEWRKSILKAPTAKDAERLKALAVGVERLWAAATERLKLAQRSLRRPLEVWGAGQMAMTDPADRRKVIEALEHPDSELSRLRFVMDAWVGLWFWELGTDVALPTWKQWLTALEDLIGPETALPGAGQLDLFDDLDLLLEADEAADAGRPKTDEVVATHPWLAAARNLALREGAFNWDLEFAQALSAGGFDLQVGNPPWVRLDWDDEAVLAEYDAWWAVKGRVSPRVLEERRAMLLSEAGAQGNYSSALASAEGVAEYVGSAVLRPVLAGIRDNLYMTFMDTAWRMIRPFGVAGLLHPEGHFTDPKAGALRSSTYRHLRRHFQFNELGRWFDEVPSPTAVFGASVYAAAGETTFLQVSNLQSIQTLDLSLSHDGTGSEPGIAYPDGSRDLRPHQSRIVKVDGTVLSSWAMLFDEPGTPPEEARLLRPVTTSELAALTVVAAQPVRVADHRYWWTSGFNEKNAKTDGFIRWETAIPADWNDVVLQGPHFTIATPFAKQPNENCRSKADYSDWDLTSLPTSVIPRTNYQRAVDVGAFQEELSRWNGEPTTSFWRHINREMGQPSAMRTAQGALIPPGPTHVHTCVTYGFDEDDALIRFGALMASVPVDYLFRAAGSTHVADNQISRLPLPKHHPLDGPMALRYLRLNCLTSAYSDLWHRNYQESWTRDKWAVDAAGASIAVNGRTWNAAVPLRTDHDRRMALVELDALAAVMLGLDVDQLIAIYRAHFAVLRKYEHAMVFDGEGRCLCAHHHAAGTWQAQLQQHAKDGQLPKEWTSVWKLYEQWEEDPDSVDWRGHYTPPFYRPDREAEMTAAYNEFQRRLETGLYGEGSEGASA